MTPHFFLALISFIWRCFGVDWIILKFWLASLFKEKITIKWGDNKQSRNPAKVKFARKSPELML